MSAIDEIINKTELTPIEAVINAAWYWSNQRKMASQAAAEYAALVKRAETAEAKLRDWQNRTPVVCLDHPCYEVDVYVTNDVEHSRGQGYITVAELCEKYVKAQDLLCACKPAIDMLATAGGHDLSWSPAEMLTLSNAIAAALPAEQEQAK